MSEPSLHDRLRFSDAVVRNPIVGPQSENPALREWHTANLGRLPDLKFMRTLWVCAVAGGPFEFSATRTLALFKVPEREKAEVLGAKGKVTEGYLAAVSR
jgi:hemoglobin